MSTVSTPRNVQQSSLVIKNKKSKKKKARDKLKTNRGQEDKSEGAGESPEGDDDDNEPETAVESSRPSMNGALEEAAASASGENGKVWEGQSSVEETERPSQNGTVPAQEVHLQRDEPQSTKTEADHAVTEERLGMIAQERENLRQEVIQLRQSLEELRDRHRSEAKIAQDQIREIKHEKEQAESQYRNLLGKVNTIRSQLGERLKADAEDLAQARGRIDDLEEESGTLREQNDARTAELRTMAEERESQSKELSNLRNRFTLSQQSWAKEREDLEQRESRAREEFEAAKQAMQDWEVLAIEERAIRENLSEKLSDLEEQVANHREAYERTAAERDSQSLTVDGLQRALQEIQNARKTELRELVENSQAQMERLQKQSEEAQSNAAEATMLYDSAKVELERALPLETEVKEKNLLIGKLRHEAVILNDHLTKALKYLKKGKPEDNIDKQLISNHFLHFVALDRTDPKKFQVLQIIAALLAWSDEQREQAGLARPGASNPSLRVPVSPWHRTPSTPALSTDFFPDPGSMVNRKESLGQLWTDFLDQEAQETAKSPKASDSAESRNTGS